ncbi:hypothetical protein [Methylogaea oryzae]|uniref:hypothetical protein n=1 Tax=Methylogaea oryzae TaxID=1295382 RepID=UPI0006D1C26E|nr:hypothetical protein [Methylogaea oryzae]
MELDWSTIALEIVNFLILVWLLKRLLYKPVQDIIAQRRAAIEATCGKPTTNKRRPRRCEPNTKTAWPNGTRKSRRPARPCARKSKRSGRNKWPR